MIYEGHNMCSMWIDCNLVEGEEARDWERLQAPGEESDSVRVLQILPRKTV